MTRLRVRMEIEHARCELIAFGPSNFTPLAQHSRTPSRSSLLLYWIPTSFSFPYLVAQQLESFVQVLLQAAITPTAVTSRNRIVADVAQGGACLFCRYLRVEETVESLVGGYRRWKPGAMGKGKGWKRKSLRGGNSRGCLGGRKKRKKEDLACSRFLRGAASAVARRDSR